MSEKPELRVDWATHEAAKYACTHWHYSRSVPAGKLVKVGVWEGGKFIGAVLFGRGGNNRLASAYGLRPDEAAELTRIALTAHVAPVSRIVRVALAFLGGQSPGLRLIVSYADPKQQHHGGVYQAGNWIYAGPSQAQRKLLIGGVFTHKRSAFSRYGTAAPASIAKLTGQEVGWTPVEWKHIYLMPLDKDMRAQILPLSKPYPKRVKKQDAEHPSALGGAVPTHTLQTI